MNWLNKPYPLVEGTGTKLSIAIVVGAIVYLFLLIYQPFGIAEIENKALVLAGFGVAVLLAQLFSFFLLPRLLPNFFQPDSWTIGKEVVFQIFNFLWIALFNFSYNTFLGPGCSPQYSYGDFVLITLAVGIFPLLLVLYFTERFLVDRNQALARSLTSKKKETTDQTPPNEIIAIDSPIGREDQLVVAKADFLYARAESNYCNIYYLEDGTLQKHLMRLSLKGLLSQLEAHGDIMRCHKSYVVNKSNIEKVDGNARSLSLKMRFTDAEIPVSRTLSREALQ